MTTAQLPHTLVTARDLTVHEAKRPLFQRVSFDLRSHEVTVLLGGTGSGKTALAEALLGLHKTRKAQVWRHPKLKTAYVPRDVPCDSSLPMSVARYVRLGTRAGPRRAVRALAEVGLERIAARPVSQITSTDARRAGLARALLRQPNLLVLDDPAAGLDLAGQAEFYGLIDRLRHRLGCGVFMTSSERHVVMAASEQVICIDGTTPCQGVPVTRPGMQVFHGILKPSLAEKLAVYDHAHGERAMPVPHIVPASPARHTGS